MYKLYSSIIKKILRKIYHAFFPQPVVINQFNTYSQAGEDQILNFLFQTIGISKPTYIDIGANKPDFGSNTYLHYIMTGSRGVCIEPDAHLFQQFKEARPEDICLNVAIGFNDIEEADFFIFEEPSLNTMSEAEAFSREAVGIYKLVGKVKTPVVRLEQILQNHFKHLPDYISLDVEGIDFEVLKSFDFNTYPVPVWIVETVDYSHNHIKNKNWEIIEFMKTQGYFVYGDTYINTIFVLSDWFYHNKK
jgi:FkbM family methyltransferase